MIKTVPLLRKALEHVTEHPKELRQDQWGVELSCGTADCIAYHIATMARSGETEWGNMGLGPFIDGVHISDIAQQELGLNDNQTDYLFSSYNTIDDLWTIAERLTDGEITRT